MDAPEPKMEGSGFTPIPEVVRTAWQYVTDGWEEPARHDQLLALVAQHSCFAWAAARYKERAGDAIADQQLDRLRRAATATMMATASARPASEKQPFRSTLLVFVALLVMAVFGLVCVKMIRDSRPPSVTDERP